MRWHRRNGRDLCPRELRRCSLSLARSSSSTRGGGEIQAELSIADRSWSSRDLHSPRCARGTHSARTEYFDHGGNHGTWSSEENPNRPKGAAAGVVDQKANLLSLKPFCVNLTTRSFALTSLSSTGPQILHTRWRRKFSVV